ncbi:hypothetical protein PISMIDRAFT_687869 [Pisolithus microcarpus 441]|uniref:G domain-containing protein n=1 Tax=Pisolithus microcarpus 441 TaxID=765257 RepID=A0A0C9XQL9_9AGAM|nr:hypothetical protein PISMIDRAFT_687869 [Pisolithus microcarpus 441]
MAAGCFSALWCHRQPPSPSDDGIVSPVLAPTGATRPDSGSPSDNGGIRDATAIETTRPDASPSPGHVDTPVPTSTQGPLPTSSGILSPALIEAQPVSQHGPEGSVDALVPGHAEEVPLVSSTSHLRLDPAEAQKHIDRIRRFRILVMGRANAGKTTILQRVCNTTDQPEILNGKGEKLNATAVQGSLTRGEHNIEDELVFQSNPRFVFHDSRGFEAGSEQQFNMMKKFVMDRAKTSKLDERIHAIWFCIPLNESHRLVMAAERKFFDECDTGYVPVIVLLTKADTLSLDAVQELMNKGMSLDDAKQGAADVEKGMVNDCHVRVEDWLKKHKFPPKEYLSLTGMQSEGADCTSLLTCTANALKEEGLQQLLISTQQSNLELCMKFAILKTLKRHMNDQDNKLPYAIVALDLATWFPFVRNYSLDNIDCYSPWLAHQVVSFMSILVPLKEANSDNFSSLQPSISHPAQSLNIPTFSTTMQYSRQCIAEDGVGAILVFEYLYFLLQEKDGSNSLQEDLNLAAEEYKSSGIHAKVNKLIQAAFQNHGDDVETLCPILVKIAQQNQLSKMLDGRG